MNKAFKVPERAEVVVVGSGILGAAIAFNLAEAGIDVAVVERGDFCGEASGANVGLVTVSTKAPGLLLDLARRSVALYPTLSERLGSEVRYERTGGIVVAMTPGQLDARHKLTDDQRAIGLDVRQVTAEEILDLEPILPKTILGGSYCPLDGLVYPFSLVAAYLDRAQQLGMRFVPRTEVNGFQVEGDRVMAVETSRGRIWANWVVNAAGAWAGLVSELAGVCAPVVPVRGQVLITERMRPFTKHVVLGVEPSLQQTWAGNALIGSTTEYVGHDKQNTLQTIRHFARGMISTYPELVNVQIIRSWSGLRPGTPDEMPILGESRKVKGFIIATGAFRNGMLYGPAIGEVIRDEIVGGSPAIDIEVARPERFEQQPAAVIAAS